MAEEENPLGIQGIDHLEFCSSGPKSPTSKLFESLGFAPTMTGEDGKKTVYTQGQVRFVFNTDKDEKSQAGKYFQNHGEGVCKMAFRVDNCEQALSTALKRGAELRADIKIIDTPRGPHKTAAVQGFGDVYNLFIERPSEVFHPHFTQDNSNPGQPLAQRMARIDHLTNNVPFGEMEHWVDFYKRIFGFQETRYFDIKGKNTGLHSKVVQLSNNSVIIPINEPDAENTKSQIQEYLDIHKGPGVQHIALTTPDIVKTISELKERGLRFLDIPDTYYELLPERGFKITENIEELKKNKILADGDEEGYLLQIFSDTYVGPLFFEIIQRKNHWGFGEGNFQALFDSMELDQKRRGYID